MKLQIGHIYVIKTKVGDVYEGVARMALMDVGVFDPLPFSQWYSSYFKRFITEEEIEWMIPVCEMELDMTSKQYLAELQKQSNDQQNSSEPINTRL